MPIADPRLANQKSDRISIDLLVAGDYRNRIISMTRPPIRLYGMWLPATIYGDYFLSGPIPGPGGVIEPDRKSTNVITIGNIDYSTIQSISDKEPLNYGKGQALHNELADRQDVDRSTISESNDKEVSQCKVRKNRSVKSKEVKSNVFVSKSSLSLKKLISNTLLAFFH